MRSVTLLGAMLVLLVTGFSAIADGLTKHLSGAIPAFQLYFFCGLLVVGSSLGLNRLGIGPSGSLRTRFRGLLMLRSLLVIISVLSYFKAFAALPLVEVFVFIGMMPLIAAFLSAPVLGEKVAGAAWAALLIGAAGILFLFPQGLADMGFGHLMALSGVASGTLSLVLMRRMSKVEPNALAQVFWPHLGLLLVAAAMLPFVWQPMTLMDAALVAGYGVSILGARWLMVPALVLLPAYVATMLLNLQFVWMVLLDWLAFDGLPGTSVLLGASCIVGSGLMLVFEQARQRALPPISRTRPEPLMRSSDSALAPAE